MGVGLAYHLAHEGWTDTVLIDKGELSSGSTWHAAGLIPHFIGSLNMAKCHAEAPKLYAKIEQETGQHAGWHPTGAIRLAITDDHVDWFRYLDTLYQVGYDGVLSVEHEDPVWDATPELAVRGLQLARQFLLPYLV